MGATAPIPANAAHRDQTPLAREGTAASSPKRLQAPGATTAVPGKVYAPSRFDFAAFVFRERWLRSPSFCLTTSATVTFSLLVCFAQLYAVSGSLSAGKSLVIVEGVITSVVDIAPSFVLVRSFGPEFRSASRPTQSLYT